MLSAILVFALDLPFHQYVAPRIFTEYPAHDFPRRAPDEAVKLMWFLFLTYVFQLSMFCYLFLLVYPRRGMVSALWFGAWLGLWVVIPNMQFFVGLDKYTWRMLAIQVPEGMILSMIMMAFFERAYRPKTGSSTAHDLKNRAAAEIDADTVRQPTAMGSAINRPAAADGELTLGGFSVLRAAGKSMDDRFRRGLRDAVVGYGNMIP